MLEFKHHHVSLNTRNLESTVEFYSLLGFTEAFRFENDKVTIVHLLGCGGIIELFYHNELIHDEISLSCTPIHSKRTGLNHFSLQVQDIEAAFIKLKDLATGKVIKGRTLIKYFFITDPDGNLVEIVEDSRSLTK